MLFVYIYIAVACFVQDIMLQAADIVYVIQ